MGFYEERNNPGLVRWYLILLPVSLTTKCKVSGSLGFIASSLV